MSKKEEKDAEGVDLLQEYTPKYTGLAGELTLAEAQEKYFSEEEHQNISLNDLMKDDILWNLSETARAADYLKKEIEKILGPVTWIGTIKTAKANITNLNATYEPILDEQSEKIGALARVDGKIDLTLTTDIIDENSEEETKPVIGTYTLNVEYNLTAVPYELVYSPTEVLGEKYDRFATFINAEKLNNQEDGWCIYRAYQGTCVYSDPTKNPEFQGQSTEWSYEAIKKGAVDKLTQNNVSIICYAPHYLWDVTKKA